MLSYAFLSLKQSNYKNIATEKFDNISNLFAAILCQGIGQQIKQGLYREYIDETEDLSTIRGKIEINGTIKKKISHQRIIKCEYDELSEDNIFNQILKTTVAILIRDPKVEIKYKNKLKSEMLLFSNVKFINLNNIKWMSIRFPRNYQTYRMLVSICQLIIQGMLITEELGKCKLASFIDEQRMCRLFEKFILEYYKQEYNAIKEFETTSPQIMWAVDNDVRQMLPIMKTDVLLRYKDNSLIIDAKYYSHTTQLNYDVHTIHSGNLYQMFTYVKNFDLENYNQQNKVSGMILYARTNEVIQPNEDYQMSGNVISVKTIDLNTDFYLIKKQLNEIVEKKFGKLH